MPPSTATSPNQHIWAESRSYKQQELNDLAMSVIKYVRDYYPDKIAIVGMRTYFKKSRHNATMDVISKIVYRVQRVRERYNNLPVPSVVVEAIFQRDGSVTLRIAA